MKVLVFGGTGAMGVHIAETLSAKGDLVYVTSRKPRKNGNGIQYIMGNAKDQNFLEEIIKSRWDVIVDFMVYTTAEFEKRVEKLLQATDQYIFISSARVYSDSTGEVVTEEYPRLLDVCTDTEYLATDEYALAKARQEDMLTASGKTNWTIIRPGLTYSEERLQLGVYEKENWLYRALHGRSIVFSKDLIDKYYTLSYGGDVSDGIIAVIADSDAYGKAINVVVNKAYKWSEILATYLDILEREMGVRPGVVMTDKCTNLKINGARYQVLYGRYFERCFDNSRLQEFADVSAWLDAKEGLDRCLSEFLKNPAFLPIDWVKEAYIDRAAHERTPLWEIPGKRDKVRYLCYRYHLVALYRAVSFAFKTGKKLWNSKK